MKIGAKRLRNSIQLVACDHKPLCCGFRWEIMDQGALAQLVAWTLSGLYRHAERVLVKLRPGRAATWEEMRKQAVRKLTLPAGTGNVAPRWHRDGLVFQQIAWLAAHLANPGKIATSMPHILAAHKGFDALLVPLGKNKRALSGIIICEEKATTSPRNQITSEVWPAVASVEAGARDAELTAELTLILERYGVTNIEEILRETHWRNRKAYRVSITVSKSHDSAAARQALFVGYDEHASGAAARRHAETLTLPNLRDWMDEFSGQVIKILKKDDADV